MEEKSTFENVSDTHLFYFMKALEKVIGNEYFKNVSLTDYDFSNNCDKAGKIVGINLEYPIDQNYIVSLIELNPDYDYSTRIPEKPFVRPERGVYSFDFDEWRTEFVRRTYRNSIVSYSKNFVESTVDMMESEGSFSYYDGREVDTDYYDGQTTETKFDKDSIRKIE